MKNYSSNKTGNCRYAGLILISIFGVFYYRWYFSGLTSAMMKKQVLIKVDMAADNMSELNRTKASTYTPTCTQTTRLQHIDRVCKQYKTEAKFPKGQQFGFIFDKQHKVAFCPIPKAACSTWKGIMSNISSHGKVGSLDKNKFEQMHYPSTLRRFGLSETNIKNLNPSYTKFLVVRHPLERIVSAYYDKMRGKQQFFMGHARGIIKRYRSKSERVKCDKDNTTCKYPSFREFVEMVVDKNNSLSREPHWASYITLCNPCLVKYDHILRIETLSEDMDDFLEKAYGDEAFKYVKQRQVNKKSKSETAQTGSNVGVSGKYLKDFESLTEELIDKLKEKFKFDLELFGYSFDKDKLTATFGYEGVDTACS